MVGRMSVYVYALLERRVMIFPNLIDPSENQLVESAGFRFVDAFYQGLL